MAYLILLLGLAVLIIGGDFLVRGAVGFSKKLKISTLVIGMTVVAFGTSAPELLISLKSALQGNPGIAIGNVVGSNIANIALVLGVTVLIFPIVADRNTKNIDFPVMVLATLLFYFFSLDGWISFAEGLILFTILLVFISMLISNSRRKLKKKEKKLQKKKLAMLDENDDHHIYHEHDDEFKEEPFWKSAIFLALGFVGLYFGADWFIKGAVEIADYFLTGNPNKDIIIGVTVVALGTSAPELVASCVAAFRKETDISVGNLIGSNIFNIFAVIGLTSIVKPIEVNPAVVDFDMTWMIVVAILLLFSLAIGKKIGRWKGAILLGTYASYISIIVLRVQGIL